jgi:hypothetical protein
MQREIIASRVRDSERSQGINRIKEWAKQQLCPTVGNMNATVETPPKIWTDAELQALPENGFIHEVIDGQLVMSLKNNFQHWD